MPRRKSRWKIALIIIIVVVILLVLVFGFTHGSKSHRGDSRMGGMNAKSAPVPVTVVPVKEKSVPVYLIATGTVQALSTVNVQPQVAGRLVSINFNEGQRVKQGDVLAQIDSKTYKATYDQARARVRSDQAQLATARGNLARSQKLIKKNYVSKQDLNTQANTVKQMQASVAADKATAESARINLDYTKVRAPISGLTGIRQVDPGNIMNTNSIIVTVTHVHPINVVFALPAKDLDQVRARQADHPLSVAAVNHGDAHVLAGDGVLKVINNRIDPDSGTFTLKAEFPNTHTELWPGQYVDVRMQVGTVENGLVIPVQAVQRGPEGDYVYLLGKDDKVQMQPVTSGDHADDTHVLVTKGLKAGDKVVTEGQFRLKPGSKVTPLKPGEVRVPAAAGTSAKAGSAGQPAKSGSVGKPVKQDGQTGKSKTTTGKKQA